MKTIKEETVLDLVLLIQQALEAYKDHSTALRTELDQIKELLEQLESRIPLLSAFSHTLNEIDQDFQTLSQSDPNGIIYYMTEVRRALEKLNG